MSAVWSLARRPLGLLLALALAVSLVAACGGDDDSGDGGGEQLKLGFLVDFTGDLAEYGESAQTGLDLAIKHINAAGGVNGQDVVYVTGDTRVDPTQATEEARRLVDVEGVHAIVGPLSSSATIAVTESVTGPSRIPLISPSATSPALTTLDDNGGYLFRTTISDAAQGVVLARLAADEGYDNVGVIYRDDPYGQGLAEAFAAAFGGRSTLASYPAVGQTSYLAELQAAAADGADALLAIGFSETEIFVREALEQDLFSAFLFCDGNKSQDLIDKIGADNLEGFKGTAPGSNPEAPSTMAWNTAYEAEYGAPPALPFVRETYDAVVALALAAEAAGSTGGAAIRDQLGRIGGPGGPTFLADADGVRGALEAVRDGGDIDYVGAATSVDWDAAGDVPSGYVEIWEFRDGGLATLDTVAFDLAASSAAPAPAATAAATEEPRETGERLRIGYLSDFTGPLAEYGELTREGVRLAIQHINGAGGVNGQSVALFSGDTRVEPSQGVEEARRLVDVEGVHAIVGPLSSTVTLAVSESVTTPGRIPHISPSATSPALTLADDDGYLFRTTGSDAVQGVVLASLVESEGHDNVGVIYRDDAWGQGLSQVFADNFGGAATLVSYNADGQPSYLAELQQAAGGDAEVLVAMGFQESEVFLREAIENGIFSTFILTDGNKSEDLIAEIGGDYLEGTVGTAPSSNPDAPSTVAWDAAWFVEYGDPPSLPFVREAYDAVIAVALAAEAAGSTDGEAIRDALTRIAGPPGDTYIAGPVGVAAALAAVRAGDDINYEGAATPIDWNAAGDVTSGFMEIYGIRGGELVTVEVRAFSLE